MNTDLRTEIAALEDKRELATGHERRILGQRILALKARWHHEIAAHTDANGFVSEE